jgi:hypothetical protein
MVIDPDRPESMIRDATLNVRSLEGTVDTAGYPASSSDIVALMVFDHQSSRCVWIHRHVQCGRASRHEESVPPAARSRTAPDAVSVQLHDLFGRLRQLAESSGGALYHRMGQILSGEEKGVKYGRLSTGDRHAIVEILRDTKPDLPDYFQDVKS